MAVLLVVTNNGEIPSIKQKTGWYLPEVAHPYKVFKDAGLSMTIVSPLGGMAPLVSTLDELDNVQYQIISLFYCTRIKLVWRSRMQELLRCSSGFLSCPLLLSKKYKFS